MRDLIRPDASFTPRELFARMQGAWFEPRLGYMWQENTGVTPTTSGGQTIGKIVDLSADRVASQATAANRPTLQFNGNLPLIRNADSTDVLVAAMPAINVRRNMLTYSEQFDNAAWVKNNCTVDPDCVLAPNGTATGDKITTIATVGTTLNRRFNNVASSQLVFSIYAKAGSSPTALNVFGAHNITTASSLVFATVNLSTGAVNYLSGSNGVSAQVLPDGWIRVFISPASGISVGDSLYFYYGGNGASQAGGSFGYRWGAQLELGSTATDYQKITDWTSEAYSSSGSTYFATPQGMSALHNQSIGTSYNLPAPQTDIYGTVIAPARLSPPLEQRLALHMHRLAGLSDADFFWQEQATDGMTGQLLADDNDTILLRA